MNEYPCCMATQHPDNADKYINIQNEPEEAIHALTFEGEGGLGIDEIMIDFEGKLTPYHQPSQIAHGLIHKGILPGRDVRITPRIPNAKKEPVFRQLMSIMSLVETNILTYEQTQTQSIQETIVPMIETGRELIQLQDRINSVIELGNKNYDIQFPLHSIGIIPLVESVPALVNVDSILEEYYQDSVAKGHKIDHLRIMFARSDSAMSYGMLASVLAVLIAIHQVHNWSRSKGIEAAPILGCGSLPFRGHLTEENLEVMMDNYAGIRTYTIQSGLRYDHGEDSVRNIVRRLREGIPKRTARSFTPEDIALMKEYIGISTKHYTGTFLKVIQAVMNISKFMPKNRDRLSGSKTGLEYIREIACLEEIAEMVQDGKLKDELLSINTDVQCTVPRAISFTAAMYTLGLPPEFIGVGRSLQEIQEKYGDEGIARLSVFYPQLRQDLAVASKYVNLNISKGIVDEEARIDYLEDHALACRFLDIGYDEDESQEEEFYHTLLKSIRPILLHLVGKNRDLFDDSNEEKKILNEWIVKMGKIRGSLG